MDSKTLRELARWCRLRKGYGFPVGPGYAVCDERPFSAELDSADHRVSQPDPDRADADVPRVYVGRATEPPRRELAQPFDRLGICRWFFSRGRSGMDPAAGVGMEAV